MLRTAQCAQCDTQCSKTSLIMLAPENERRENAADDAEVQGPAIQDTTPVDSGLEIASTQSYCPRPCVGNRQGCLEVRKAVHLGLQYFGD